MPDSRNPLLSLQDTSMSTPSTAVLSQRLAHTRQAFRQLLLGSANVPQQCVIGIRDPQSEISVWLEGAGTLIDVTHNNVMVGASPLAIGIGLGKTDCQAARRSRLSLRFRAMKGERRLLGEIRLRMTEAIPIGEEQLCVFETRGCRNYCVPRVRLWIRNMHHAYRKWKSERRSAAPASQIRTSELRSVFAFYICPRPVVLVSVLHQGVGNIFPMDLIGPVGTRHFALALHNTSAPMRLVERSRRIAVSNVPIEHSSHAFELGKNHNIPAMDFSGLSFPTIPSETFGIPVPQFSLRTREMQIETVRTLESHTLFVATVVKDRSRNEGVQMFQIHGFYQAWRQRQMSSACT
jgi:flavin reductase (DIM6/NTAB) family NADH-FMN oxidoreductase RutF